jgi:hypothetical protein
MHNLTSDNRPPKNNTTKQVQMQVTAAWMKIFSRVAGRTVYLSIFQVQVNANTITDPASNSVKYQLHTAPQPKQLMCKLDSK